MMGLLVAATLWWQKNYNLYQTKLSGVLGKKICGNVNFKTIYGDFYKSRTSFLQLQKIHATCKDHFYAWFSSIGQMAFNSLQGVMGNKGKNLVADWKKKTFDSRQEVKVRP